MNQPFPSTVRPRPASSSSSRSSLAYQSELTLSPTIPRRPHTARPLRSSPLAGPSSIDEIGKGKQRYRPSRISAPTSLAVASSHLDAPRSRSSPSSLESATVESSSHTATSASSSETTHSLRSKDDESISRIRSLSKRLSIGSSSIRSTKSAHSDHIPPTPEIPAWVLKEQGKDFQPSTLQSRPRPPSISRDPNENWLSFTDPIPRFSRLSMGGGVVMPISAKSHSNRSRPGSIISVNSITPPPSLRQHSGDSFTRGDSPLPRHTSIPRASSSPSSISSSGSSLHIEVGKLPVFSDHDLGVLHRAKDGKGVTLVRGNDSTASIKDDTKNSGFARRIVGLVKFSAAPTDETAYHTHHTAPTDLRQKQAGGFRRKWNSIVASIRR